jgi:glycerol-3-phosphate acyltransferase PlsY
VEVLIWTALGFLSGSVPFALIVGQLAGSVDIRRYGDHNPGATNVLRSIGWRWAALALLLDYLKGALPVGAAWFYLGIEGWGILPVALAPLLGHAYSPWLKFRGGKAVATTFGVWSGLTIGAGPTILGLLLGVMFVVFQPSGWAMILAMLSFGWFVGLTYASYHPEFLWVWAGNFALLVLRHWDELKQAPRIRSGVISALRRK